MPRQISPEIIVSGIHFDLTPSLKTFVHEKAGRLLRHEERITRVRIGLDYEQKRSGSGWFVARGHVISYGPGMNASASHGDCHQAITLLIDKLARMLRRRAVAEKGQRNHPHLIEFPIALPKAG